MTITGIKIRTERREIEIDHSRSMGSIDQDRNTTILKYGNDLFKRKDDPRRAGNMIDDSKFRSGSNPTLYCLDYFIFVCNREWHYSIDHNGSRYIRYILHGQTDSSIG